jgi:ParB/RepB/Spo0J family partition protein
MGVGFIFRGDLNMKTLENQPPVTIPSDEEKLGEVRRIPIQRVIPQEGQPRRKINQRKVEELAASIKSIGQQVPGIVYAIGNDLYELVDGHRRRAACAHAGVEFFIAFVREKPPKNKYVASVVANLGREDYSILDYLEIVRRLRDEENYTLGQIAEACSKSTTWVNQMIAISKLHPDVKAMLDEELPDRERISHSTALALVDSQFESQPMLARSIARLGLNQSKARNLVQNQRVKSGHAIRNRPDREFSNIRGLVTRAGENIQILVEKPKAIFRELVRYGHPDNRKKFLEEVQKVRKDTETLETKLKATIEDLEV